MTARRILLGAGLVLAGLGVVLLLSLSWEGSGENVLRRGEGGRPETALRGDSAPESASAADGRYRLEGLPGRTRRVHILAMGSAWVNVEVIAEPGDDVVLSLGPGGTIRGTVTWPEEMDSAWVRIDHRGVKTGVWRVSGGEAFTLTGVPEGTWPVTARWKVDGVQHEAVKEARAGDTLTFDLKEDD